MRRKFCVKVSFATFCVCVSELCYRRALCLLTANHSPLTINTSAASHAVGATIDPPQPQPSLRLSLDRLLQATTDPYHLGLGSQRGAFA
jgi:hypothetical protein